MCSYLVYQTLNILFSVVYFSRENGKCTFDNIAFKEVELREGRLYSGHGNELWLANREALTLVR